MKLKLLDCLTRKQGETLAYFGDARLIKHLDGKLQLIGGSPDDHTAAKEWISLFLHNALVSFPNTSECRSPQTPGPSLAAPTTSNSR